MDITNDQAVGATADGLTITIGLPKTMMGKPEALRLAAYLVALADPYGDVFTEILYAVQST